MPFGSAALRFPRARFWRVVGILALPMLAGCAYDGGYGGPPAVYGPAYGYGGYGYSCGWRYDCDDWGHRYHKHHRYQRRHVDHDGDHRRHDDDGSDRPRRHAADTRPRSGGEVEGGGPERGERRASPPGQIWVPTGRDSRR